MFQTSRTMVFADGVPLHYLLQSRWNGSPRWSMVAASEIAQLEVLYGPFSAEYSGNAMGGVVLMESAIPQGREFRVDSSVFSQQFKAYGADETLQGNRAFISYGDRIGDLAIYLSYNRLQNTSQPQTFYYGAATDAAATAEVTGGIVSPDEKGNDRLWLGDTGSVQTLGHNYKFKAAYEVGAWDFLLNLAYEDREDNNQPQNYLRDNDGNILWSGVAQQQQQRVMLPSTRFGVRVSQWAFASRASSVIPSLWRAISTTLPFCGMKQPPRPAVRWIAPTPSMAS